MSLIFFRGFVSVIIYMLCFFFTQVKFDVRGRELVMSLSYDQHDGDETPPPAQNFKSPLDGASMDIFWNLTSGIITSIFLGEYLFF